MHRNAVCAEEAAHAIDAMRALCSAGETGWEASLARVESGADATTDERREALRRCRALGIALPAVAIGRTVKPAWDALPMKPPGKNRGGEQ